MSYGPPPKSFSNRFHTKPRRRARTAEDEALVNHVHASIYPFHSQPVNSCFSHQPPSRKIKSFARGTFGTDTLNGSGWGYVYACPCGSSNPVNTQIGFSTSVAITNNAFAGPNTVFLNSPFLTANYSTNGLNFRSISCGLRVRNITPMLSRCGTLYALRGNNDNAIPFNPFDQTIADLDITGNAWRCDTSGGKWSYVAWSPTDKDQMEYTNNSVSFDYTNSALMARTIAFVAQAPHTAPQTYEFEIVEHFEVISGTADNDLIHSCTRGVSHPRIEKVNNIIADLHRRPQVMENESSAALSAFIADVSATGHDIKSIVDAACDIASKTAAVLPQVYAATRALGSFL